MEAKMRRDDFAQLKGNNLCYLDTAATCLIPRQVVDRMQTFMNTDYANVSRSGYRLAARATDAYEKARQTVADFFNCHSEQIVFTKGCTDGMNMLIDALSQNWQKGDEIITSVAEHHSVLVPVQQAAKEKGCKVHVLPLSKEGTIDLILLPQVINERTRLIAITHISNVLGCTTDVERIHKALVTAGVRDNVHIVVDGAQSAARIRVDFPALHADFYVCSAHKMYGPTGIGALIGTKRILESLSPSRFGGGMVDEVTLNDATWTTIPQRFEAGTPPIIEAVGFAAAIEYLNEIGVDAIQRHELELMVALVDSLNAVQQCVIYGSNTQRRGVVSFNIQGVHAHDVAAILDDQEICVRAGNMCAQPLLKALGVESMLRASIGVHSTTEDIVRLIKGIQQATKVLSQ